MSSKLVITINYRPALEFCVNYARNYIATMGFSMGRMLLMGILNKNHRYLLMNRPVRYFFEVYAESAIRTLITPIYWYNLFLYPNRDNYAENFNELQDYLLEKIPEPMKNDIIKQFDNINRENPQGSINLICSKENTNIMCGYLEIFFNMIIDRESFKEYNHIKINQIRFEVNPVELL